jgi:hypothetical protein
MTTTALNFKIGRMQEAEVLMDIRHLVSYHELPRRPAIWGAKVRVAHHAMGNRILYLPTEGNTNAQ